MKPVRAFGAFLLVALALIACGGAGLHDKDYLAAAREAGEDSDDPDRVGEWLMAELVASGGDVKRAAQARAREVEVRAVGDHVQVGRPLLRRTLPVPALPLVERRIDGVDGAQRVEADRHRHQPARPGGRVEQRGVRGERAGGLLHRAAAKQRVICRPLCTRFGLGSACDPSPRSCRFSQGWMRR